MEMVAHHDARLKKERRFMPSFVSFHVFCQFQFFLLRLLFFDKPMTIVYIKSIEERGRKGFDGDI
jgi:hypothetical protein